PEFWDKKIIKVKTKSPFELAISSVRYLGAQINAPYQLFDWTTKMGQQIYYCQSPAGFSDKAQYWINTGALMNRMNFELALTAKKIRGVRISDAAVIREILLPEFQRK
ncbi:MAG: DUF1800 family protein, partial [Chitinophagaceae bacterium]|nr:DUF1800 family protein [Chitinophagaceae bacterium]